MVYTVVSCAGRNDEEQGCSIGDAFVLRRFYSLGKRSHRARARPGSALGLSGGTGHPPGPMPRLPENGAISMSQEKTNRPAFTDHQLFIGGEWVDAGDGATYEELCPATGETLCRCAEATREDVAKAVKAANTAFAQYKTFSVNQRSDLLNRIADAIDQNRDHLAMIESCDNGKTLAEAGDDLQFTARYFRYCAGALYAYEGRVTMTADTTMNMILREPIGVVGMIIPWNVPFIIGAWKMAPALATGNCMVVKPSMHAALGLLELMKLVEGIVPPGVINVVTGAGSRAGQYILESEGIQKLSFTGSTEVGRSVGLAAARKIIPATLELGGKSADIVFADCDMSKAMSGIRAFLCNAGQVCSAGSRLFVQEEIYDEVLAKTVDYFNGVKVGLPWLPATQMGAITYRRHMESVLQYINLAVQEGATVAAGGTQVTENGLGKGNFIRPTLLTDVDNRMRVAQEEIFGPVLCMIRFKTEADVIRMANDSTYGLSGAVFTRDIDKAFRVARSVQTGRMWINAYGDISTTGAIFGGVKQSGIGREGHHLGFDYYTQVKSIVVNLAE
jgi:aldehyde dehydrogenase (NAD+)